MTLAPDSPPLLSSTYEEFDAAVRPRLLRIATAMTLDRELASDLVQDALLEAYRSWDTVRGLDRPDLWARRVLVNRAIDAQRRQRRRRSLLDRVTHDRRLATQLGDTVAFWEAVRRLPPRQREVVTLRTAGELSLAEIGETLGIAEGTVKATLHAARRSLGPDLEVAPRPPQDRRRPWPVAVALAAALAAGAVLALAVRADDPSVVTDQPKPPAAASREGVDLLAELYAVTEQQLPLVVPLRLPRGWASGAELVGLTGDGTTTLRVDFVKQDGTGGPLPSVELCWPVANCPPVTEPGNVTRDVTVAGYDGGAQLYGVPEVLDEWAGVEWSLDVPAAAW